MHNIIKWMKGLFNRYTLLLLFTYFVFGTGFSYAYFAFVEEDTSTIVGNVISIDADLTVERVVGTNTKMVPMQNSALSNALNNVDGTSACVDANGNLSCQVYKITLTNNGSRLQHVTGTVELYAKDGSGNVYNNLRWQELTNTTTVKTGSNVNRMGKSILEKDITLESKESMEWYIAVWISEMDYDQINTDKGQFGGTVTFEVLELSENFSNAPNLDNGNLLPVYYDDTVQASDGTYGVWKKADSTNQDNSWYDYENKMWANAVIVDPAATTDYSIQPNGTTIADSDIIAFYVWIPRYKYRVWNLNRQGITEDTAAEATNTIYAYPAFTNGIDIEFEYFEGTTGNVECIYDTATVEADTNLSDKCYYNGSTTPITITDLNTDYTDAWYTHPAFTFGGEEKEGFWIGKFETSTETSSTCYTDPNYDNCNNTNQNPRILPDVISLRFQNISNQFTTSKKIQIYLSNEIDAHMLTNLEWGAVVYLTHSLYGLCTETDSEITCEGVNQNNSSGRFTGRSGGAIAGNISMETVFYEDDTLTTNLYNLNGYYNYKGYKLDYSTGESISKESITKVASTTKNITGVYDMSGGSEENVMGNMVDSSNNFYPSYSGTSWNGISTLDNKYYNSYSYGTTNADRKAYNRGRLGDAIAEVLGETETSDLKPWKPGSGIAGANSNFVSQYNQSILIFKKTWFRRGGNFTNTKLSVFNIIGDTGSENIYSSALPYCKP